MFEFLTFYDDMKAEIDNWAWEQVLGPFYLNEYCKVCSYTEPYRYSN